MPSNPRGWRRSGPSAGPAPNPLPRLLAPLAAPAEIVLSHAARRLARRRPDVFERLGEARTAVFLIVPDESPFAFRLEPDGPRARVLILPRERTGLCTTRIAGRLADLLALFDGSLDADAAFFARRVRVEGDTAALTALHNALEAAELELVDLAPLPEALRRPALAAWRTLKRVHAAVRPAAGAV
ncbi:MAG: SCP2 sterol-binding domain-containing protein [Phenylobacterium sp.]|uniref:ubiquinone anaerobic biosynthesis accessory factor UbiT n=1 Tax=Phenylobacterium sp. TaxID=1871053 RepID=UPI002A365BF1|nr:SCP2 sterol-binding domain-containing protein [Phenylobacterium sp.]MDX9997818.1 SCP2 sterol-binding domain-containing protein [Phenylobacterium sp.]